jgi:hypothetical protein
MSEQAVGGAGGGIEPSKSFETGKLFIPRSAKFDRTGRNAEVRYTEAV